MVTALDTKNYPKQIALRDESLIVLRPMEPGDKAALRKFFERVPEEGRHYLKESVTAPETIQAWTANIDFSRVVPIVAVAGDEIVADATLHRSRAPARRHIGEVRIVVDPAYRERCLGSRMIRELVDIAVDQGLHKVTVELVDRREKAAILAARGMGFTEVAVLREAVLDDWGNFQDVVMMELPLKDRNLWWRF